MTRAGSEAAELGKDHKLVSGGMYHHQPAHT